MILIGKYENELSLFHLDIEKNPSSSIMYHFYFIGTASFLSFLSPFDPKYNLVLIDGVI